MTPAQEKAVTTRLARIIHRGGGPSAVARRLGLTPPAVRAWTLGSIPYHQHLGALCEEYGVNLQWLLTGEGSEEVGFSEPAKSLKESPASAGEAKAARLAEMICELDSTPPAFLGVVLARVREEFEDFMRTVQVRQTNHASPPVKYSAKSHRTKRQP